MSYILEALKKAQSERQLGHAPDIHAAPLHAAAPAQRRTVRTRLWIGAAAAAIALLAAAAWLLKPAGRGATTATAVLATNSASPAGVPLSGVPAPKQAIAPAPAPTVAATAPAAAQPSAATAPAQAAILSQPAGGPAQVAAPAPATLAGENTAASPSGVAAALPAPAGSRTAMQTAAGSAPMPAPQPSVSRALPAKSTATPPLDSAAPLSAPAPRASSAAPAPAASPVQRDADDTLPTARELPEAVRQSLPQVTLGGYIYATNPADRLVLIDKALRHEGEEIAPGLTLERLQPRYAVLNFRGTRYRVAY